MCIIIGCLNPMKLYVTQERLIFISRKLKFSSVNVTLHFILKNNNVRQRNRFYHRKINNLQLYCILYSYILKCVFELSFSVSFFRVPIELGLISEIVKIMEIVL